MALVSHKDKAHRHPDIVHVQLWPCHSPNPQPHTLRVPPPEHWDPCSTEALEAPAPKSAGFGASLKHLEGALGCSHGGSSALQCLLITNPPLSLCSLLQHLSNPRGPLLSAPPLFQPSPITLGQALSPHLSGVYPIPTEAHGKIWHQQHTPSPQPPPVLLTPSPEVSMAWQQEEVPEKSRTS